jgi:imidazolonepropionase-like amidohydrolase
MKEVEVSIAFVGGNVINGSGIDHPAESTVIIEESKIKDVCDQTEFSAETQVIDISGKTIMPGLIDAHNHMAPWMQWLVSEQDKHLMYLASKTVYFMRATLEAGCTAVRDMGGLEAGWVQAQKEGLIQGPRLLTSLVIIQPTNGLLDYLPGLGGAISRHGKHLSIPGIPAPWCDGPWEARKLVREVLRYGADIIKIANSSADLSRDLFTAEELKALVDEAHNAGISVACHVENLQGVMPAVQSGVDSIEHGFCLDQACVEEMAKRGTWLVPTLYNAQWHALYNPVEDFREQFVEISKKSFQSLAMASEAGVPIAMGTDNVFEPGVVATELSLMVEAGMTPAQAIIASTARAAECLGMDDEIGQIKPGLEADLLVVSGNPLDDISVLEDKKNIELVMQAGKPVAGTIMDLFSWQPLPVPACW